MDIQIPPLHLENENVDITVSGNTVYFKGSIDSQEPREYLEPFFTQLHQKIIENNIKKINVDIRELDFLNSCGIGEFIAWIAMQNKIPEEQRYTVHFILNPDIAWQELSFSTLVMLNPTLLTKSFSE